MEYGKICEISVNGEKIATFEKFVDFFNEKRYGLLVRNEKTGACSVKNYVSEKSREAQITKLKNRFFRVYG